MNWLRELLKPRMDILTVMVLVVVMALDSSFWLGFLQLTIGTAIVEALRWYTNMEADDDC